MMPRDTYSDPSDEALLEAFVAGDARAARALTLRLTPRVYAQALRVLQNRAEAEDVSQEALLRLWRTAADWEHGRAKVTTWLYRVVANLCIDRLRKRRTVDLDQVGEMADEAPTVGDHLQSQARISALHSAIAELPERQAHVVTLKFLEELSNIEIAEILDLSVDAVESLVSRAKRGLTAALMNQKSELGFEDE